MYISYYFQNKRVHIVDMLLLNNNFSSINA